LAAVVVYYIIIIIIIIIVLDHGRGTHGLCVKTLFMSIIIIITITAGRHLRRRRWYTQHFCIVSDHLFPSIYNIVRRQIATIFLLDCLDLIGLLMKPRVIQKLYTI